MSAKHGVVLLAIVSIVAFSNFFLVRNSAQNAEPSDPSTVYSNPTSLTINTATSSPAQIPATVYPSNIAVSGMTGTITRVAVTLNGFTEQRPSDADFLLVSPTGAKFIFLSDGQPNGGGTWDDKLFTFSDDATTTIPSSAVDVPSGNYRPTSGDTGTDAFPAPAPAGPYSQPTAASFASVFNGADPNGTWSLFAVDDSGGVFAGSINSGWSITITTDGAPTTFANSTYIGLHDFVMPTAPYGTLINVSGVSGVISNLKVTLTGFSHTRPSDVDVLLVSPNGKGLVVLSDAGGGTAVTNADLVFDDSAPGQVSNPIVSGTYRPTDLPTSPDFFPGPAPLRPYHNSNDSVLSSFNGFSPNGEWRLFVVDSTIGFAGSISGGWSLDITTVPPSPPQTPACGAPAFATNSYGTGSAPTNFVLADFNNDFKADVAVTNQVSNNVSVLLGNGDGTFLPATNFAVGASPYSIAAGKFNADNDVDLAVVNSGSNTVSILLGNGAGLFSAPTNFPVGPSPISVAAGDLNNDGKLDLAVANFGSFFAGSVSILLGNGTGSFTTSQSLRTRTQPSFVAIANLNPADTNRDLVVANFGADGISTFFGNGNGTFVLSQNLSTGIGSGPVALEIADAGIPDGNPDITVANYNNDTYSTCINTGNGTFASCGQAQAGGPNPISVAVDDFLGSGTRFPAVALSGSNQVKVGVTLVPVGQNPNAIDSVDLNGDGKPDLISVNFSSNDLTVMMNSCTVAVGNIFDWDGDRKTDFNVFRPSTQAWFDFSVSQSAAARNFSRGTDKLVPADYDGDFRTDYGLYRPENGLWVVQSGQLSRPIYFLQFGLPEDIPVPADYDGDGKADVAVFRPSNGTWYVRRSTDNSVDVRQFGATGDKPVQGDFDGDKKSDLAVFRPSTGVWYIWRSSDSQFFILQFGISEDKTVVGDYDGDSKADIAIWRPSTSDWWIRRSTDGVVFAVPWGAPGDIPVVGDFENDGKIDTAVWRPSDRTWYVRKSSDGGAIYFIWGLNGDVPVPSVYVR